jgi:hypothetical protein
MKNLSQGYRRCPAQDSNRAPPEYKARALPLHQHVPFSLLAGWMLGSLFDTEDEGACSSESPANLNIKYEYIPHYSIHLSLALLFIS